MKLIFKVLLFSSSDNQFCFQHLIMSSFSSTRSINLLLVILLLSSQIFTKPSKPGGLFHRKGDTDSYQCLSLRSSCHYYFPCCVSEPMVAGFKRDKSQKNQDPTPELVKYPYSSVMSVDEDQGNCCAKLFCCVGCRWIGILAYGSMLGAMIGAYWTVKFYKNGKLV